MAAEVEAFNDDRALLFSLAYRMLGSVMDAEDIVQEAFLRWQGGAHEDVRSPRAYLATIVTRLCLDHLRSARVKREEYVGPWLPEPLLTEATAGEMDAGPLADSLSLAFMVLLESLSPLERAVFLLHDVFVYPYDEIAVIVGKSEANCRQIAQRARRHVEARRPRFAAAPEQQDRITRQFIQTCVTGDMGALVTLLADDITLWTDGGGKAQAARRPIEGALHVARFILGVLAKIPPGAVSRVRRVNGQPAIILEAEGRVLGVVALEVDGERVAVLRIVVNPDKLRGMTTAPP
ncbi:MAG: RNA polymerase sigma-70 factor [Chloroflexota bacterium]